MADRAPRTSARLHRFGRCQSLSSLSPGNDCAFLYPDLETALLGSWEGGTMVAARPALLSSLAIEGGVAVPSFCPQPGPTVCYSLSTEHSVGPQPLVGDPYEARMVGVRGSQVEGGGEGLYALRDIREGEVVAFYNGVRLPYEPGQKEVWETSGYKIFVNADHSSGERIDLPGELAETGYYCATLGHKMNHSFEYNCAEWFFEHPRHGTVPCAVARTAVAAGQELLLHYGYDPANCPEWYRQAMAAFLADRPELAVENIASPDYREKNRIKHCLMEDPVGG